MTDTMQRKRQRRPPRHPRPKSPPNAVP